VNERSLVNLFIVFLHLYAFISRAELALNPNSDTMGGVESFVMRRLIRNRTQEFLKNSILRYKLILFSQAYRLLPDNHYPWS
jgi:hypothetical protein